MAGVFIFTAPDFGFDCKHSEPRTKEEEEQTTSDKRWNKTTLTFNGSTFEPAKNIQQSCESEETGESDIMLDYDPTAVQESVCFYLDSEFYDGARGSFPASSSFAGLETGPAGMCEGKGERDVQKEFEDIKCASQKLLVERGAPSSSFSSDEERTGAKRKLDEMLDFNTHQLTMEDIYTQVKSPYTSSNSSPSPVSKPSESKPTVIQQTSDLMTNRAAPDVTPTPTRVAPDATPTPTGASPDVTTTPTRAAPDVTPTPTRAPEREVSLYRSSLPKVCDKLFSLRQCTEVNSFQNILCVVLQVNDTREVRVKSGASAGSFVSLSSIVVADESKPCLKLTLWREASRWADKITPGDFVVATSIKIGKWRSEFVGQTTVNSGFYNLHRPKRFLSDDCLQLVSQARFDALVRWVRTEHPYLLAASQAKTIVQFTEIAQLRDNTLVHFRGKLISIHRSPQTSSTYQFGGQQLTKITAVIAEQQSDKIELSLWGRQAAWMNQLQEGLGQVWEFQYLTAKYSRDSGCVSLHSTPRSTKTRLLSEDRNAAAILSRFNNKEDTGQTTKFATLNDLLEAKYTGLAEVEGRIYSVRFHCGDELITVDKKGCSANLFKGKLPKLVYVGCGSCARPLEQDLNNVYGQCSYCVVRNLEYKYTIKYYFKPLTICLRDSQASIEVDARGRSVSRLFQEFPAKTLAQNSAQGDQTDFNAFCEHVDALIDKKQTEIFIIVCRTSLDENSFVENRSFTLQKVAF